MSRPRDCYARPPWYVCVALVCACLPACEGVGRALVDERPVREPGKELCGEPVPSCADYPLPSEPAGMPTEAQPVDLQLCGATTTCPGAVQGLTGSGPITAGGCDTTLTTEHTQAGFEALAQRYCSAVRVADDGDPASPPLLRLDGAHLQSVNVSIETERPLTVQLASASLAHVWFELVGPVTLRVEDSRELTDLRVTTAAAQHAGGEATVVLESVTLTGLALGTEGASFQGALLARRSSLHRATLRAASIDLESVLLDDARIEVERFQASDATLARLTMSAERTLLSGCTVNALRMLDCDDFSAILGELRNSRINGCSSPVRLYGTMFSDGVLDGAVVLDDASLSRVRLGLREPTAIEAWDSHIDHVRFCSPQQSVSFGGASSVACVRCEGSADQPRRVDACIARAGTYEALGGPEACAALAEPPACTEPEPTRMRPPR